jgi:hypothetical protein
VLLIEGAYAAEMRPLDGQITGCIFFNSNVPAKQIQHWQLFCSPLPAPLQIDTSPGSGAFAFRISRGE